MRLAALIETPMERHRGAVESVRLMWPEGEEDAAIQLNNTYMLTDQRNWVSGLHGGGRLVHEGSLPRDRFPGVGDLVSSPEKEATL